MTDDHTIGPGSGAGTGRDEAEPSERVAKPGREQDVDRGSYLGFAAHEVRNPLATALWSAELLVRLSAEERGGPRGEKLSGMSLRALQRLRILVEDHFLAERLEVRGIPVRPEEVGLREATSAAAAKAGVADLSLEIHEDLCAWADRALVERALEGVLSAAGRGKATVLAAGARQGGMAALTIAGAPPEPRALEVPQKGSPSDPTGRALALYMAQRAARAVGGAIAIEGGAFVVRLPIAPEPA